MGGRGAKSKAGKGSSLNPGDKWVKEMDERRAKEAKQIQKEQDEQEVAVARIDAQRQEFNPNSDVRAYNLNDDESGYKKEYYDSYIKYRETKANEAWNIAVKLKAGKEVIVPLKILGNAGMNDEVLRFRKQTKAEGGGIEVFGKRYMGVYAPRSKKNFIEEIKGW